MMGETIAALGCSERQLQRPSSGLRPPLPDRRRVDATSIPIDRFFEARLQTRREHVISSQSLNQFDFIPAGTKPAFRLAGRPS